MSKQLSNNYHKSIAQGKKSIIKQIMKAPNFGIVPVLMKAVALMFATHCRRPDPSTPAGLQQQPVLLWRFHPWASANGETNFPPLLVYMLNVKTTPAKKEKLNCICFCSLGAFGREIPKSVQSSSRSHEGEICQLTSWKKWDVKTKNDIIKH